MANPRKSKTPEHQLHHFSECLGPGEVGFIHDKQSYKSSWLSQWGAGFKWTEFPRVKDQSDVDPWIINIYPAQGGNAERYGAQAFSTLSFNLKISSITLG